MPVSWQTRFERLSATSTFFRMVSRTRLPVFEVSRPAASASASRRSCGMSFSAQTYRWAAASSTTPWRSVSTMLKSLRFLCGSPAGAPAEHAALEEGVAHHPVAPVGPACDLAAGEETLERRLGVRADHEAAVLVVEDRVGQDPLLQRVDAGGAVAAQHVRERDLGVLLGDPGRVEGDGRTPVRRLDALALRDLVEDRLQDLIARPQRVGELLAVRVQEDGPVGPRRLGDRVALHVGGPGAAVRVVLERVEVARLGAEVERDPRHLAGRAGVVRREFAALLRLAVAAAARGEDHCRRFELMLAAPRPPAACGALEAPKRRLRKRLSTRRLDGVP